MKEVREDNNILADRLMANLKLDRPSASFTSKIMDNLDELEVSNVFRYQPLIRTRSFVLIAMSSLILILSVYILQPLRDKSWLSELTLKGIDLNQWEFSMPVFSSSSMMIYASVLFVILLFVQIHSLTNLHKKSIGF